MTDLPMLFSAPMVLALLAGRKTQTRRLVNPQPSGEVVRYGWERDKGATLLDELGSSRKLPIWAGDRLYVREAWRAQDAFDELSPSDIGKEFEEEHGVPWCPVFYEADKQCDGSSMEIWQQSLPGRLRAGMHMPKWASRITLIVTDVRVQRLQDISGRDAADEGCELERWKTGTYPFFDVGLEADNRALISLYRQLWDSLNEKRAPWDSNPFVVAYTFTVHKMHIDQVAA